MDYMCLRNKGVSDGLQYASPVSVFLFNTAVAGFETAADEGG
jgi:hypothetical protein